MEVQWVKRMPTSGFGVQDFMLILSANKWLWSSRLIYLGPKQNEDFTMYLILIRISSSQNIVSAI